MRYFSHGPTYIAVFGIRKIMVTLSMIKDFKINMLNEKFLIFVNLKSINTYDLRPGIANIFYCFPADANFS